MKSKKHSLKKKLAALIVIVVAIAFFVIKEMNLFPVLFSDYSQEYVDVLPLKEAGIKGTGTKDFSKPFMLSVDNHTFLTNRGYELEILGDSKIEIEREELSVLPTNDRYANSFFAAYVSFYSGQILKRSVSLHMSENVVNSLNESFVEDKRSFSKAYIEQEIGEVKNGYVLTYVKSPYPQITISRFFIFPDETGFLLQSDSLEELPNKLNKENTLKELKKILSDDFSFMDKNFVFKKSE
uniref:Uncharacterized protein n=1 Tax=Candidatus Enterococcus mansonii TaxID=1834181 RepID=A0A242CH33_9ENTE|nr:hypothetical protein A5880_000205 [Enterococcus sp. 4G2_DIV0659]